MGAESFYPKLRQVDIFPADYAGQKVICLRDPLNLSGKILFYPYPAFFIIRLFDGCHSITDIQMEFMRRFGELLYREKILELANQLEEHFLLDSERFRQMEREIIEAFKKASLRPMALDGETYPDDRDSLRRMIESSFTSPEGPGLPVIGQKTGDLLGAIAPHIDYSRGGSCYAWAHRAIVESSSADLFIILGTAHSATQRPFVLTQKNFQTPWGPVETDRDFLREIETSFPFDLYEDEFIHKGEHSIELQLIFLRSLWQRQDLFQIVPVLCGSFHEAIQKNISPMELPGVAPFIEAFKMAILRSPKRICLLASADLAHVGLRFGDAEAPNRFSLQSLADEDRSLIGFAERKDAEGFYESIRRVRDRRRICGLPPIYTLLHLLGSRGREGRLLKYDQSLDTGTQSVVTFASAAFYSCSP